MSHAEQLICAIRRSRTGLTYGDLEALRVSSCPWKRLAESAHRYLKPHEALQRKPRQFDGLVVFRVVRTATKWTA